MNSRTAELNWWEKACKQFNHIVCAVYNNQTFSLFGDDYTVLQSVWSVQHEHELQSSSLNISPIAGSPFIWMNKEFHTTQWAVCLHFFIYRIFDYSVIKNIYNNIYYLLHFYFLRIHSIWIELCCASWYTSQAKPNSLQIFT